jgi:hypothetical protein
MDDQDRKPHDTTDSPLSERAAGGTGAPTTLGQGGPSGNPSGPRDANDPGSTRYGKERATGANDRRHGERKETSTWTRRQGGDQAAGPARHDDQDAGGTDR